MKKIICILFLFFAFIPWVFAGKILVENVFSDINSNYQYRDELQLLYDRGMIFPDASGRFSPDTYLNRDEFVGISMEVICKKCIQPQTDFQFIEEYASQDIYFDIDSSNPYFYCVAEADKQNYVRGYDIGESCQNGTSKFWERPFCPLNRINLEEAIAVLLRNSGIFTIEDNAQVVESIRSGKISENLSSDVNPTDNLGNPYTFYWYLQKALSFEISEYDEKGNEKVLKLLELDSNNNINPKKSITKEEFLRMAYIVLKSNSCLNVVDNNLALAIDIWEKSCEIWDLNCEISKLDDPLNTYDFTPDVEWFCEAGIDDPSAYTWRFYNTLNGEEFFHYGTYLDNIKLPSVWEWKVYLTVQDKCWNTGEVYSTIVVEDPNPGIEKIEWLALNVDILVEPIIWAKDLLVKFEWVAFGWIPPYSYAWNFWDTISGVGKYIDHVFKYVSIFEVSVVVTDSTGLNWDATVLVKVLDGDCSTQDIDGDGVNNCDDVCLNIPWTLENAWCPIFEVECDAKNTCSPGYDCNYIDSSKPNTWVCLPVTLNPSCLYTPDIGAIFWNTSCNTCPCVSGIDFLADIRRCDLVFPAITSPSAKDIYSKGKVWQIQ